MNETEKRIKQTDDALRDQQSRIWKLEQELKHRSSSDTVIEETNNYIDTEFVEKGLYAQLLFMVGRTTDAKKVAEKWIAEYELSNKIRKPTKEEQAEIDRKKEEDFKKLMEIFPNIKKNYLEGKIKI